MKKIVFLTSPNRQSTEALHWCLHKAKEGERSIRALYVMDQKCTQDLEDQLADSGHLGKQTNSEVKEALMHQYEDQAKLFVEESEKQGRTFQIKVDSEIVYGSYIQKAIEEGRREDVDILVCVTKNKNFIRKFFEGEDLEAIRDKISCEVKIYKAD